jgi:hypothetical protein
MTPIHALFFEVSWTDEAGTFTKAKTPLELSAWLCLVKVSGPPVTRDTIAAQ